MGESANVHRLSQMTAPRARRSGFTIAHVAEASEADEHYRPSGRFWGRCAANLHLVCDIDCKGRYAFIAEEGKVGCIRAVVVLGNTDAR